MTHDIEDFFTKKIEQAERRIEELANENKYLRQCINVASFFVDLGDCKSCHRPYAIGYLCRCGRDNSLTNEEWDGS